MTKIKLGKRRLTWLLYPKHNFVEGTGQGLTYEQRIEPWEKAASWLTVSVYNLEPPAQGLHHSQPATVLIPIINQEDDPRT